MITPYLGGLCLAVSWPDLLPLHHHEGVGRECRREGTGWLPLGNHPATLALVIYIKMHAPKVHVTSP